MVAAGSTLRGAGTVGALSLGGLADPGNAEDIAGKLNVNGGVALQSGGTLKVDMPSATGTAGAAWDLLAASGPISSPTGGVFAVWVTGAATGFNPAINQSWKIVDGSSVASFDAERFIVDTTGFEPEFYGGVFSISNDATHGDLYLVFTPSVHDADYFDVAANGPTEMQLEFELNGAGQDVVIVYNDTGIFTTPEGSPPAVGGSFAGGTVVYQGSQTPQTHSGLISCTHYYYMLFSMYDGRYSTGLAADDTTSAPPPPVVLEASNITIESFRANWQASVGASGYRLDVSTSPYFTASAGSGAQGVFLKQGFEGTLEDNWPLSLGNAYISDENPITDNPTAGRIRTGAYSWQRRGGVGTLQFSPASIEGYTGRTVTVHVASISTNNTNGAETNDTVRIFVALNGAEFADVPDIEIGGSPQANARWGYNATGVVTTVAGTPVVVRSPQSGSNVNNIATAHIAIPDAASSLALKIVASNNAASEVWAIDDVYVSGSFQGSSFVEGYEDLAVSGLSHVVTGLTENTTYYYRVRAESSGGCVSANSATESVVTSDEEPEKPEMFEASDGTSTNHVELGWEDIPTETSYKLYRSLTDKETDAVLIATIGMNLTNWLDSTALPGQLYWYWIAGMNHIGGGDWSSPDTGYRKLMPVENVDATEGEGIYAPIYTNKVVVSWGSVTGATSYVVWRSLSHETNTAVAIATVGSSTQEYQDMTAVPGWPYFYWIEASNNTSGSTADWSDPAVGFRTPVENVGPATKLELDGREMVRATVIANSDGDPILILHSTTGPVLQYPNPGTSYVEGDTVGAATVVYKGVAGGFQEHVIAPNTTNHYRIYSIQGHGQSAPYPYYSDGLIPASPLITMPYPKNVYSETFSYTNVTLNTASFTNKSGGHNWTGAWDLKNANASHAWQVQRNLVESMPAFKKMAPNYPTTVGNRAVLIANGIGHSSAYRTIAPTNTGTIFVGALVAYKWDGAEGADKYMTIGLMDGSTTELEFGKVFGEKNKFSIRRNNANAASSFNVYGWGDAGRSTNDWYWMVLKYDFNKSNGTACAKCYYQGENIPYYEPAVGDWDATWTGMNISKFDGIELKGGSTNGSLGMAIWDEIRVSSIWPELIGQPGLIPWPPVVDFGEVESTLSSNVTVYIANDGGDNVPLYLDATPAITLAGPDAPFFSIDVNRFPDPLFYQHSNAVTVTFWPTNMGTEVYTNAWLEVVNNSGVNPYPIYLQGIGVPTVSTNLPMVSNYWVGYNRWVTDALITSGVFAVSAEVYHVRGILSASYNLLNEQGVKILENEPFTTWTSTDGMTYRLMDETHTGYWPATPSSLYQLQVTLMASNLIGHTNDLYTADGVTIASDLMITEYVEGSSTNKAIEIFNGTAAAIDLSGYGFRLQMNNTTEWGDYEALLRERYPRERVRHRPPRFDATLKAKADWENSKICTLMATIPYSCSRAWVLRTLLTRWVPAPATVTRMKTGRCAGIHPLSNRSRFMTRPNGQRSPWIPSMASAFTSWMAPMASRCSSPWMMMTWKSRKSRMFR